MIKLASLLALSAAGLVMSGCSSLNPAGSSQFACKGDNCPTPLEVYAETHEAPASVEFGRTPAKWRGGGTSGKDARDERNAHLQRALDLTRQDPAATVSGNSAAVRPIREPSQVARIWIAPWIDQGDNLYAQGFVFTEVQTRTWNIGEPEIRHSVGFQALPTP